MEIKVPDLGVDSAEVSEIMVNVGDIINVDDNIVLLESDKASVEVPAPQAGKITAINIQLGDKVKEGDVILMVEAADNQSTSPASDSQPVEIPATQVTSNPVVPVKQANEQPAVTGSQPTTQSQTFALPDLGVDSAEISEWMVAVGDTVTAEQPLVLVESDKASVEVPAPASGKIIQLLVNAGDTVSNGQDFVVIAANVTNESQPAATISTQSVSSPQTESVATSTTPATIQAADNSNTQSGGKQHFTLPDLGVDSAQISEWMVAVGDKVTAEQPLLLVESDKASVEVPAPVDGTIVELLVKAGDTVRNGQPFVVIEQQGSTAQPNSQPTSPTAVTATASSEPKTTQPVGQTPTPKTTNTNTANLSESQINSKNANVYAGPAVRKLTRQLGVDISEVVGSAVHGRIVKEDVFAFVKTKMLAATTTPTQSAIPVNSAMRSGLPNLPDMSKTDIWGETTRQDLSRLQKVSIPQLNYNTYLPQVTQFDLADITDTEKLRSDIKDEFKKQGVSLTILAFIMKVTAYALMQHPKFNSHLSDDNTQIILRKSVNLGFAVAIEDGLTVPVIQNVQDKGIKQLAVEISELAKKARDKKLSAKELTGASFTISSQGNLGGTYFTPLVNWPQVAILGVSESTIQPRWNENSKTFEPRLMLPLSLSYDHRVINGADAAVFTRFIATLLADPRRVLF